MKKCAGCDHASKRPLSDKCGGCTDKSNWSGREVTFYLQRVDLAEGQTPQRVIYGKCNLIATCEQEILCISSLHEALKKASSLDTDINFCGSSPWQVVAVYKY